jgi:dihydropteroate synthase
LEGGGVSAQLSAAEASGPLPGRLVARPRRRLRLRGETHLLGERTWIMGVLNVTPDSFSDGGRFLAPDAAVAHGLGLLAHGADILDVGGESTRPGGSERIGEEEERRRVVPVIEELRCRTQALISIDTTRAGVAEAALEAGADLVNDVSGLAFDPKVADVAARYGAAVAVMHLRGDFATMHETPAYDDVPAEVLTELRQALGRARAAGIDEECLIADPGLGFSKHAGHSLEALAALSALHVLERPLLVGPSRKSFIGKTLELPVGERLWGTAAAVAACVLQGAHIVRVHDVVEMSQVARLCDAILAAGAPAC